MVEDEFFGSQKKVAIVKMDSILCSSLEDDFLGYVFYKEGYLKGLTQVFFYLFKPWKFQYFLSKSLEKGDFLENIVFNEKIIYSLQDLVSRKYKVILVSEHYNKVVNSVACYLNLRYSLGNKLKEERSLEALVTEYLIREKINNDYIYFSSGFDFKLSKNCRFLIQTNCFYYLIALFVCHKRELIVGESRLSYVCKWFITIVEKYLPLVFSLPINSAFLLATQFFLVIKVFFFHSFFSLITSFFVIYYFFPSLLHNLPVAIFIITEANTIWNSYRVILSSRPIKNTSNFYRENFVYNGILKSYGSLRIGILIFLLSSLVHFRNPYFFFFKVVYISFFFIFPFNSIKYNINYSNVLDSLNTLVYFSILRISY